MDIDIEKIIEKHRNINSPYIFKELINRTQNNIIDKVDMERVYTVQDFFVSEKFKELENKYTDCNLKLTISGMAGNPITYSINEKTLYDKDLNQIIINDINKSKYKIYKDIDVIYPSNDLFKGLTLKEYIEIMKTNEEFHMFLHELTLEYLKVYIMFGKNETLILDQSEEKLEDKDDAFKEKISNINLIFDI